MYAATVKGRRLNFAVSGMLWKRSLVMRDEETQSLWSHILGKCMDGTLKGEQLEIVPSLLTDWGTWKKQYPKTTAVVMSRTARNFTQNFYRDPEKFVVGLALGKSAKAWRFDHLKETPVINDQWRKTPIVVHLQTPSYSSTVFSRKIDDKVLTFVKTDEGVIDRETLSSWNLQTGKATTGKLAGTQLRRMRSIPSFTEAWKKFHPDSIYYSPGNNQTKSP